MKTALSTLFLFLVYPISPNIHVQILQTDLNAFPLRVLTKFDLVKCNLTKLTTTSLAVKWSTSLEVRAVHELIGQVPHELSN